MLVTCTKHQSFASKPPKSTEVRSPLAMAGKIYPRREQESRRKPGGKIIRGCGRGGIYRAFGPRLLPSRIREAFLGSSVLQLTKMTVSNLDGAVADSDVIDLFGHFGPLKFAKVQRDEDGNSLGYADVLFEKRADAIEATKHYNGALLAGRKISIQLTRLSYRFKKASSVSNCNVRSPSKLKRSKSKFRRTQKTARLPYDNELDAQLKERLKSQLNISENTCENQR